MKCPGQDTKYWNKDAIFEISCPECRHPIEFFKDDSTRRCGNCNKKIVNPKMNFGCASYCKFAKQCLGSLPEGLIVPKSDLLKDRVAVEMKKYFGNDFRKIGHAVRIARHAEKIGKAENANLAVVICAAYLHDIGIENAENKYNSDSDRRNLSVARRIMEKAGAEEELVNEVCNIIGHRHMDDNINFKVLYDSDMLTDIYEAGKNIYASGSEAELDRLFLTGTGRKLAGEVLERNENNQKNN